MNGIDRSKVRDSFHRNASGYDTFAVVQRRVVERLVDVVQKEVVDGRRLLDIGCGTGNLLNELRHLGTGADFTGVDLAPAMIEAARAKFGSDALVTLLVGDAERLPLQDSSYDVVTSSSTFQWLPVLSAAFSEAWRVAAPGGLFCFAMFGLKTLYELRSSYREALERLGESGDRTHRFHEASDVLHALEEAGFTGCSVWSELEVEFHPDVPSLLKSIRNIGAGNASPSSRRGLGERRVMTGMMDIYQDKYKTDAGMPATYEVIYGIGRK